jgi:WS/DGAT/MGAT family acyltransferase
MQQLTGLDASFLYLETANAPMHISGLAIYDQSSAPGGKVRFKEIIENTITRISGLPSLTRHLATVPLNLDHPWWVSDGNFDPEFHIRHIALPSPGDWRQLCIQISRLHARPLDRGRPLWELYVIEGLDALEGYPPGCFALFTKMHHAAVDGASGMDMTSAPMRLSKPSLTQSRWTKRPVNCNWSFERSSTPSRNLSGLFPSHAIPYRDSPKPMPACAVEICSASPLYRAPASTIRCHPTGCSTRSAFP